MSLSESLIWALNEYGIFGVKILCDGSVKEEAAKTFLEVFTNKWNEAFNKVEVKYGDCESKEETDYPVKIKLADYGFFVHVNSLAIRYAYGEYYDLEYGYEAFDSTMEEMHDRFPGLEYDGYIAFTASDVHGGEGHQHEVSSVRKDNNKRTFDFIGEALRKILESEEYVPDEPEEAEGLKVVITGKLQYFENRDEITEYIKELGATVIGSVSKKTDYLINNDANSKSSKNKKARDLCVPIITERDFIIRFGDPDEYGIKVKNSPFWDELLSMLEALEDYDDTVRSLYAYSRWIKKEVFDRAIGIILTKAKEYETDSYDTLMKLVKQLEAGEEVEGTDLTTNLPDGHMEARGMSEKADKIRRRDPSNKTISVNDTFDAVLKKAEEGDAEAKFTAGKYFITNQIVDEQERALNWIREAADEGIDEAVEYISWNSELFF